MTRAFLSARNHAYLFARNHGGRGQPVALPVKGTTGPELTVALAVPSPLN